MLLSQKPENALKPAGLKDNKKPQINTSGQKEIIQDSELELFQKMLKLKMKN